MDRPKGLGLTTILMALCNVLIWATIKPGSPLHPANVAVFYLLYLHRVSVHLVLLEGQKLGQNRCSAGLVHQRPQSFQLE